MIVIFVGKITDVQLVDLHSQDNDSRSLVILTAIDVHTGLHEKIHLMTADIEDLETAIGKYIAIPYIFFVEYDKAVFTISQEFRHQIIDTPSLLVKLYK